MISAEILGHYHLVDVSRVKNLLVALFSSGSTTVSILIQLG